MIGAGPGLSFNVLRTQPKSDTKVGAQKQKAQSQSSHRSK